MSPDQTIRFIDAYDFVACLTQGEDDFWNQISENSGFCWGTNAYSLVSPEMFEDALKNIDTGTGEDDILKEELNQLIDCTKKLPRDLYLNLES
jgi:hypothetical protein